MSSIAAEWLEYSKRWPKRGEVVVRLTQAGARELKSIFASAMSQDETRGQ